MFCEACGVEIEEDDLFCRRCGLAVGGSGRAEQGKSCVRSRTERMVVGVCGGCASYFGKDVTLVRIVWSLAALIPPLFPGVVAYVVCWLLMPVEDETEPSRDGSPGVRTAAASK